MILGIAGGTGSGKTTIANKILDQLSNESVTLIHYDSYYKDQSHLNPTERAMVNFDHPEAIDNNLFLQHIGDLKAGKSIQKPVYDFKNHTRLPESILLKPTKVILVEGTLLFSDRNVRDIFDIRMFVDTDADIRFIRRLKRDISQRGRTSESVIDQYLSTVRVMHKEFVEPAIKYAHFIIPEGGHNLMAVDVIVTKIRALL